MTQRQKKRAVQSKTKPRTAPVQAAETWEALNGMVLIDTGKKRRSGRPHTVLAMSILVCMTEADAKLVAKKHPGVKFVKRTGSTLRPEKGTQK